MKQQTGRKKQRLKQKDLVYHVLSLLCEEYEKSDSVSIWDVSLSNVQLIQYLKDRYAIDYKTDYWIWTQLKRYEEDLNMPLFRKQKGVGDQDFAISLHRPYINFFQKKHLYISEKLKVANGLYEAIKNFTQTLMRTDRPVAIALGAGGICYYVASILAQQSQSIDIPVEIYTHNVGALEEFSSPQVDVHRCSTHVPAGKMDPVTYAILGEPTDFYTQQPFDFIIQGTSFVYEGNLYIESAEELPRKEHIVKHAKGLKILALTKHEFCDRPEAVEALGSYGSIFDYDQLIVPRNNVNSQFGKSYKTAFETYKTYLEPVILHWNYEIYRIKKNT
ncbi:MAG: hypothetical protein ACQEQU_05900 [Spirochaetota bacterium]